PERTAVTPVRRALVFARHSHDRALRAWRALLDNLHLSPPAADADLSLLRALRDLPGLTRDGGRRGAIRLDGPTVVAKVRRATLVGGGLRGPSLRGRRALIDDLNLAPPGRPPAVLHLLGELGGLVRVVDRGDRRGEVRLNRRAAAAQVCRAALVRGRLCCRGLRRRGTLANDLRLTHSPQVT